MNDFAGNSKGGSSGSMCINDKQELVGILWGAFSGGGVDGIAECLAVDLLFSKQKSYFNSHGYDVMKDYWNNKWSSGLPA
jgi:hypothetical protein